MNMRPQKHEQKGRGDLAVLMAKRNCSQQKEIAMIMWPVTGHGVN